MHFENVRGSTRLRLDPVATARGSDLVDTEIPFLEPLSGSLTTYLGGDLKTT